MAPKAIPKTKLPSKGAARALDRVLMDQENLDKIRKQSEESIYFDKDGPSVRNRRQVHRAQVEYAVQLTENVTA